MGKMLLTNCKCGNQFFADYEGPKLFPSQCSDCREDDLVDDFKINLDSRRLEIAGWGSKAIESLKNHIVYMGQ